MQLMVSGHGPWSANFKLWAQGGTERHGGMGVEEDGCSAHGTQEAGKERRGEPGTRCDPQGQAPSSVLPPATPCLALVTPSNPVTSLIHAVD